MFVFFKISFIFIFFWLVKGKIRLILKDLFYIGIIEIVEILRWSNKMCLN